MRHVPDSPDGRTDPGQEPVVPVAPFEPTMTHLRASTNSGPSATQAQGISATAPTDYAIPPELLDHPRYRVIEVLGGGGMGTVYKAEHRVMERVVALKVINAQYVTHRGAVQRFRRESKAAARLVHPRIVAAYDAEQAGNLHFLVMEYVEGTSLGQLLKKQGPFPVQQACEYVHQAALGLQFAHSLGMVHRDIKPHNLMLNAKKQIKILDFGLARFASENVPDEGEARTLDNAVEPPTDQDSAGVVRQTLTYSPAEGKPDAAATCNDGLTDAGSVMGTADYMAPEQFRDAHRADIRADIYSLGCTLYHLVSGQPPFPHVEMADKLRAHQTEAPRPLNEVCPEASAELASVVAKMLAKNPADRYQTPAEAATALAAAPVSAREEQRNKDRVRQARWLWPVAVAALLLALAIPTLLYGPELYRQVRHGSILVDCDPVRGDLIDGRLLVEGANGQSVTVDLTQRQQLSLPAGEYRFRFEDDVGKYALSTEHIILGARDRRTVLVRRQLTQTQGRPSSQRRATLASDFAEVHDATPDQYLAWLARMRATGFRPALLSAVSRRGEARFTAIAFKGDAPEEWAAITGASREQYQLEFNGLSQGGWRPVNCVAYQQGVDVLFASLWTGTTANWAHHHVLDDRTFQQRVTQFRDRGMRPNSLCSFVLANQWRVAANWIGAPNDDWEARHHLSLKECGELLAKARSEQLRPDGLSAYEFDGSLRFFTCLVPNTPEDAWTADLGLSEAEYVSQLAAQKAKGNRPQSVSAYDDAGATRYAVVWVSMKSPID